SHLPAVPAEVEDEREERRERHEAQAEQIELVLLEPQRRELRQARRLAARRRAAGARLGLLLRTGTGGHGGLSGFRRRPRRPCLSRVRGGGPWPAAPQTPPRPARADRRPPTPPRALRRLPRRA